MGIFKDVLKVIGAIFVAIALCFGYVVINNGSELPDEEYFPLETGEQVKDYVEMLAFPCDGVNMTWESHVNEAVNEFGYYGNRVTGLAGGAGTPHIIGYVYITECRVSETPTSGSIAYSLWIDPNNGWVSKLSCDNEIWSECPENVARKPASDNPNYWMYLDLPFE